MLKKSSSHSDAAKEFLAALQSLNEQAVKNGAADMTEEEIEAEIKAARAERRARKVRLLEDA